MQVKTSSQRIWWDDTTDNWPGGTFWDSFINTMQLNNDLKINYIDSRTIEVVVQDKVISYIWVNDGYYDYYYYYDKIVKIIKGGFVLQFKLDVYTTYTLPYFRYLENSNITLKVNRHKKFEIGALQYEDEMLKRIPKIVSSMRRRTSRRRKWTHNGEGSYTMNGIWQNDDTLDVGLLDYRKMNIIPPIIYVAVDYNNAIHLVPCFVDGANASKKEHRLHLRAQNSPPWYDSTGIIKPDGDNRPSTWYRNIANNSAEDIIGYFSEQGLLNKVIGVFSGPPMNNIDLRASALIKLDKPNVELIAFQVSADSGMVAGAWLGNMLETIKTSEPTALNETKLSIYASNTISVNVNGQPFKLFTMVEDGDLTTLQLGTKTVFSFTTNGFFTIRSKYYPMNTMILNYSQELPIYIEKYQQYIQATKNVRDTGLNIARQNMVYGMTTGTISGLASIGTGVATGNFTGAANAAMNTLFGGAGQVMGYNQKRQMMEAELADKAASVQNNIEGGSIRDASTVAYILDALDKDGSNIWIGDFLEWEDYNTDTIKALNNILYLYGQYNPKVSTIRDLLVEGKFNYFKFDAEYLSNVFATTIRAAKGGVPVEREFYDEVFEHLVNGLRLWKGTPQW